MDKQAKDKGSYVRVKANLDEIAGQIRDKDLPLEKALDLYEEAIRIGNSCADLIDVADFSEAELEAFRGAEARADGGTPTQAENAGSPSDEPSSPHADDVAAQAGQTEPEEPEEPAVPHKAAASGDLPPKGSSIAE